MRPTPRFRGFALVTLTAFLLAQPAAWCAALCLLERHHVGAHAMPGTDGGRSALTDGNCHTTTAGAVQRDPPQLLSPMAPARAPVIAIAAPRLAQPPRALPTLPHPIFHPVEPPPPRLV